MIRYKGIKAQRHKGNGYLFSYLSVVFILIYSGHVSADQANTLFMQANKAYTDGNYEDAAALYHQILQDGTVSGEVYFNLGNTYYKLNQIGRAILYYEKARHYLSRDDALEQNLKIARLKIVDKIEPIPRLFLAEWWEAAVNIFSLSALSWLSFGFFALAVFWAALYLLLNRRILSHLAWSTAMALVLTLCLFAGRIYQFETSHYGIILAEKISVAGEPTLTGQELFILHQGTRVKINRELEGWIEISLEDGKTGWIKADALESI